MSVGLEELCDEDDWLLSMAVEHYEDCSKQSRDCSDDVRRNTTSSTKAAASLDFDGATPMEKFRPGYLWVSDLTRQNWCEQQLYYTFTVPVVVEENPVMTEGSSLHLARELAVHDVVKVKVTSNEDIWAVKVLNLLSSLISLLNGQTVVREVPIFGAPFNEDVFIVGLVDELRFDSQSFQVDLWEFKTRKFKSMPSRSQQAQHRLQVMMYKKLFDDLVKGKVSKEVIAKHLRLDLKKSFGNDIQEALDAKCLSGTNLDILLDELLNKMQCMTCIMDIGIEYAHQSSKESIGMHTVEYSDDELETMFKDYLGFWRGQRKVEGVDIEEAWKCQSCDFADICDWRKRKAEEYSKHARVCGNT